MIKVGNEYLQVVCAYDNYPLTICEPVFPTFEVVDKIDTDDMCIDQPLQYKEYKYSRHESLLNGVRIFHYTESKK